MSWFARSIANTFQLDLNDDANDSEHHSPNNNIPTDQKPQQLEQQQQQQEDDSSSSSPSPSPSSPTRGVKEDLSEITKTLTRQLWGVASFLAPPPPSDPNNPQSDPLDPEDAAPEGILGIRRDFAEIGGRFRSGISKLSNNIDVSEITKLASSFLQVSADGEDYVLSEDAQAIGVTEEVLSFVRDVVMHPETWLDFPLPDDDEDDEDFELSDAQQEHALTVESLAPRLAALRIELCPGYMSEGSFWKIYFVLLHPRLEPHAAALLSTPEIVKARASLTHELKSHSTSQTKVDDGSTNNFPYSEHKPESSQEEHSSVPLETSNTQLTTSVVSTNPETEKHYIQTEEEVQIVDKSVIQEEPRNKTKVADQNTLSSATSNVVEDKDEDDWLKEDSSENIVTGTTTTTTTIPIDHDEDVSFSDLEEDDDEDASTNYKKTASGSDSSTKDSRDWVQLGSDSSTTDRAGQVSGAHKTKESNDWLDVDDIDVA
ncbi:putative BSD domain-containing protein [Helianthus annuus]|nr:putative BSD domain-containing protein [Helianthus annuus]KAJ0535105.1 putative BSD domain-containing protein [Helianthus annuus]KAJ0542999.1 putative BSD domain-containing protein [Helianthus annuus]KAJ0708052.1 putative BSD domain-containing protein [Helianthus annuus]KAJ0712022.1 putative BSD domain-containing protein [Helianthus annuus]